MTCKYCKTDINDDSIFCQHCGKKQSTEIKKQNVKSRGNGTGTAFKLPSGKWRVEVTLGYDEKCHRRIYKTKSGFKTKKEALEYIPTLKNIQNQPINVKFNKVYQEWSARKYLKLSQSKITAYKIAYNKCKPLEYMIMSDIRTRDIQAVVDADKAGYYPKRDIKTLCNLMFKYAIQEDYALKNYAVFVELPPVPKSTREAFSKNEIKNIWNDYNEGNEFTGYILILIYTGIRLGELQNIKKEHIFLDKNYIIGGIKTEAGKNREIIIHPEVKPIVEIIYSDRKIKLLEMSEDNFYEKYYETLERAGTRRLTPHCCRHTCVTLMVETGLPPEIIKSIVGHEDYQTTLEYTHISLDEKIKAMNNINLK